MNYNNDFLIKLFLSPQREKYVRLTALTFQEKPVEYIEGKATGGSINVDGNSAVRRTCSLTLIAKDVNITDFYWGLKSKFKLEIGLKNNIDSLYPDIIWFEQGIFIITSFNTSYGTSGCTINISGKDKMCQLNGDISGNLPHTTDFGIEEYYNSETDSTIYTSIPIKTIIREMIQNFGNEPVQNIIINDVEDYGLDLLEYRGDITLYLLKNINTLTVENMTINNNQKCYVKGQKEQTKLDSLQNYDSLTNLNNENQPKIDIIKLNENKDYIYSVIPLTYGMIAGYRQTDLTYPGDLIATAGETITSVLDKIKNILGDFEYFYDVKGRFVFQKKKGKIIAPWNLINQTSSSIGVQTALNTEMNSFNFLNNFLITAFQNSPNLLNIRNDFTVWGKKKSPAGAELDIHMRYAIDVKPTKYYSLIDQMEYSSDEYDWRELIYKMALDYRRYYHDDDFLYNLVQANPQYPYGKTGYEQYYTDLEGFWRLLYDPKSTDSEIYYVGESESNGPKYWNKEVFLNPENLIFWFDFLDAEASELSKYSVPAIGSRPKVINDNNIKKIYYRDIPNVIFITGENSYGLEPGYTKIQLQGTMENLFTISSKNLSCKEKIDELLYQHTCYNDSINLTSLPIYYLQPNTKILVKNDDSNIYGEYLINKLTIPLTYNGTMSINATKIISSIM